MCDSIIINLSPPLAWKLLDAWLDQNYLLSHCMNQNMNSPGTHPSHKAPERKHTRPTCCKWALQNSDPQTDKTRTVHFPAQLGTPPRHTLQSMVRGQYAPAVQSQGFEAQLCPDHSLTLTRSALWPSLVSGKTGRLGEVSPCPLTSKIV